MKYRTVQGIALLVLAACAVRFDQCSAIEQRLEATVDFVEYDRSTDGFFVVQNNATPATNRLKKVSFVFQDKDDSDNPLYIYTFKSATNITNLALRTAQLNGKKTTIDGNDQPIIETSPLYNATITGMRHSGKAIVMSLQDVPAVVSRIGDGNNMQFAILNNKLKFNDQDYLSITTNIKQINDASGVSGVDAADYARIKLFEAKEDYLFAAVSKANDCNHPDAGIAVLYNTTAEKPAQPGKEPKDSVELKPLNAVDGNQNANKNKAVALTQTSVVGAGAQVYNVNCMQWDNTVKRLYIGVEAGDRDEKIGLLVGRVTSDQRLIIEPAVPLDANILAGNTIVGDTGNDAHFSILNVKLLFSSTALPYIIVRNNRQPTRIYALPVFYNKASTDATDTGKISSSTSSLAVADADTMVTEDSAGVLVGRGDVCGDGSIISSIFTAGDAVYVTLERAQDNGDAGTYHSQAIFNEHGRVIGWTEWRRSYAAQAKAGADGEEQNILDSVHKIWMNVSGGITWLWTGEADDHYLKGIELQQAAAADSREAAINQVMSTYGTLISQASTFPSTTPGFAADNAPTLFVGLGTEVVTVAQTGIENAAHVVVPVAKKNFTAANVVVMHNDALTTIAPLTTVALSQCTVDENGDGGWLFVGGYSGVAVLSRTEGAGWNSIADVIRGLSGVDYFRRNDLDFRKLTPSQTAGVTSFSDVTQLQADATDVYLLDANGLYKIPLDAAKFTEVAPAALEETRIFATNAATGLYGSTFVLLGDKILLGTTHGLYWRAKDALDGALWNPIYANTVRSTPFNLIRMLDVKSDGNRFNVYLLDVADNGIALIYRLIVDLDNAEADQFKLVAEASTKNLNTNQYQSNLFFVGLGRIRAQFFTNGTHGYNLRSRNDDADDLVKYFPIGYSSKAMRAAERLVRLGNDASTEYTVGNFLQDYATGDLMIAGSWGLKNFDATTQPKNDN